MEIRVTAEDLRAARIPARYAQADESLIKNREELEAYALAVALGDAEGRGLYLGGPVGTGKSRALGWLCERIIFHAKSNPSSWYTDPVTSEDQPIEWLKPLFVRADDLVNDLFREKELIVRAERSAMLLIDDIGSTYESEYATAGIASLVETRYSGMLPLAITSNWKPEELKKRQGWERTADRLKEMCQVLAYLGPSMRAAPGNTATGDLS